MKECEFTFYQKATFSPNASHRKTLNLTHCAWREKILTVKVLEPSVVVA